MAIRISGTTGIDMGNTSVSNVNVGVLPENAATKQYVDDSKIDFVKLTGDQTIEDVKTFSLSPVVPTPTADTQAVNKQYVDNMVVISRNGSNSYAVAMAIVFGS